MGKSGAFMMAIFLSAPTTLLIKYMYGERLKKYKWHFSVYGTVFMIFLLIFPDHIKLLDFNIYLGSFFRWLYFTIILVAAEVSGAMNYIKKVMFGVK